MACSQLLGQPDDPLPKNGGSDQQFDVPFGQTGGSKVAQAPQRAATESCTYHRTTGGPGQGVDCRLLRSVVNFPGAAAPGGDFRDVRRLRHNVVVAANPSIFSNKGPSSPQKNRNQMVAARRRCRVRSVGRMPRAQVRPQSRICALTAATRATKPARCLDAMSGAGGASGTMAERYGGTVIPGRGVAKAAISRRASRIFAGARR